MRIPVLARALVALVALVAIVAACGTDDPAAPGPDADVFEAQPFPWTRTLDAAALAKLEPVTDPARLVFRGAGPELDALAAEQIVLAPASPSTPVGLLRAIQSVSRQGSDLVVTTEAAPIEHAFAHLKVRARRGVDDVGAALEPARASGLRPRDAGSIGKVKHYDYYPFNGDGDPATTEDQIHVVADLGGKLSYVFGLGVDWSAVFESLLQLKTSNLKPKVTLGFHVDAEATAKLAVDGVAAKAWEKKEVLATKKLKGFTVGPLYFEPELSVEAELEGAASSKFSASFGASATAKVGVGYDSDVGGFEDPPQVDFKSEPPVVSAAAGALVRAAVAPKVALRLYGIAGFFASLGPFAKIEADTTKSPCWDLRGGLEGKYGFDVRLLSMTLAYKEWKVPLSDKSLATGVCTSPPTGTVDDQDPKFTPWAKSYLGVGRPAPTDACWTDLAQTADGGWLVGGAIASALVKIDPAGKPLWTRRYDFGEPTASKIVAPQRSLVTKDLGTVVAVHPHGVMKLDFAGNVVWANAWKPGFYVPIGWRALAPAPEGGVYLAGTIFPVEAGSYDGWIVRLRADGSVAWSKRFGSGTQTDHTEAIVPLDDGLLVLGTTFDSQMPVPATRGFALRLDANGNRVFSRVLRACGAEDVHLHAATRTRDGRVVVVGQYGPGQLAMGLAADAPVGAPLWAAGVDSPEPASLGLKLWSVEQLDGGGFAVGGVYWTPGGGTSDEFLIERLDSVGRPLYARRVGGAKTDGCAAVARTGDGGAILAGHTDSFPGTEPGLWAMKLPLKTGAISLASGHVVADVSLVDMPTCVSVLDDARGVVDANVPYQPLAPIVTTPPVQVTSLAP